MAFARIWASYPLAFYIARCQYIDMVCIYCASKCATINSRPRKKTNTVWRRRACMGCGAIFTSVEEVDLKGSIRFRSLEGLEPFSKQKLCSDLAESLSHRKTALNDAEELYFTIIERLLPSKSGIVERKLLISTVINVLKRFDKAATAYYQAHHTK
jgi:transcriptional repressor NrdR